jgi:hypothetical protein
LGPPGQGQFSTIPRIIPAPEDWITYVTDTPRSAVTLFKETTTTTYVTSAMGRNSTGSFFTSWCQAAATATSETLIATPALATQADFLPPTEVEDLKQTYRDWLLQQIRTKYPALVDTWITATRRTAAEPTNQATVTTTTAPTNQATVTTTTTHAPLLCTQTFWRPSRPWATPLHPLCSNNTNRLRV